MATEKTIRWAKAAVLFAAGAVLIVAISFNGFTRAGNVEAAGNRKELPDFRLSDLSGADWHLRDDRGKVVLLNFWATWCEACRYETPDLVQVAHRYSDRGLVIVGIDMDDDPPKAAPPFVRKFGIPYKIVIGNYDFGLANHLDALPTSILLDRQGRLVKSWEGAVDERDLAPFLNQLLNERA
jgi:cytochrome c biogenesis protein CcmG/thiol:disulfide interchange protein DsbE